MAPDLLVKNGRCVLSGQVQDADIAIADGRIIEIAESGQLGEAGEVIDAAGMIVLPGVIDAHVHVRDPGQTHKEDYAHATRAAAVGGVTTIISQPNTDPPTTDAAGLTALIEAARESRVDHAFCAGISAEDPDKEGARDVVAGGAVAFEVLGDSGALDGEGWLRLFDAVAPLGTPLAMFATDCDVMRHNIARARLRPAATWRDFTAVVSAEAETIGFHRAAGLSRVCGTPLIVRQVTTGAGLDAIRQEKERAGTVPLWAEVNAHHLFLTDDDLERVGPYAQMLPPPRLRAELPALWDALSDGTVDFISTDHAPHSREEKEAGRADMWAGPTGIPGLDNFLCPLLDAVFSGRLALTRLVELVSENPARIHGLAPAKGAIAVGADADLVLVDPEAEWTIGEDQIFSRCGWSAFQGWSGRGVPVVTMLRGQVVARGGRPLDGLVGRLIRPQ
jgi:dihydroorotase (multifunctional complex type)